MYSFVIDFSSGHHGYAMWAPLYESFSDCAKVAHEWGYLLSIIKNHFDPEMTIRYLGCAIV